MCPGPILTVCFWTSFFASPLAFPSAGAVTKAPLLVSVLSQWSSLCDSHFSHAFSRVVGLANSSCAACTTSRFRRLAAVSSLLGCLIGLKFSYAIFNLHFVCSFVFWNLFWSSSRFFAFASTSPPSFKSSSQVLLGSCAIDRQPLLFRAFAHSVHSIPSAGSTCYSQRAAGRSHLNPESFPCSSLARCILPDSQLRTLGG